MSSTITARVIRAESEGYSWIVAVVANRYRAMRMLESSKHKTYSHEFELAVPSNSVGVRLPTYDVWVELKDGLPVSVSLSPTTADNWRCFPCNLDRSSYSKCYDKWFITLDDENRWEETGLYERGEFERTEPVSQIKQKGHKSFITLRRRYSNSLPFRIEVCISSAESRRTSKAQTVYDNTCNGKIDIDELEYNVDYTLTDDMTIDPKLLGVNDNY